MSATTKTSLEQRLTKLEAETWKPYKNVICVICEGETPTLEEQSRIDEAEKLSGLVIVRLIV